MRRSLERMLRVQGFTVLSFGRPSLLLADEIPDSGACLVIDVHLPEMNGVQLLERMRASGCKLRAILITGRDDWETQQLIERAGAVTVLQKPFHADRLVEAISRAITTVTN